MATKDKIKSWWGRRSDEEQVILTVLGATAVGILVYKLLPDDDASGGNSTDITIDTKNLTYPENQYKVFADAIEVFLHGAYGMQSWTEDDTAIGDTLKMMMTIDDVYMLLKAYDYRFVGVFLKDGGNLVESISEYLDQDVKDEVNANYQAKNINFYWP